MGTLHGKAILFVGGGLETVPGVELAKAMGLHVVVSDANPDAPCAAYADDVLAVSTYDIPGTVAATVEYHKATRPLDGVICLANDVPLTVATIGETLGLTTVSVESARLSADKVAMKDRFKADGVPIPWYMEVSSAEELTQVVARQGYPLIVKPVDSRGARGVQRLVAGLEIGAVYDEARRNSPTGRVMVERFLTGPQVSTESLVVDGQVYTIGFADRNYELLERYAPYVIEDGGNLPSTLPASMQQEIHDVICRAAKSIGITDGVIKGDIVVHNDSAYVIEVALRLSGGFFCTHEIPLSTGVDFVGCAIRLALSEPIEADELTPKYHRHLCQRYLFPGEGEVVAVEGADEVASWDGIALCQIRVTPGDLVGNVNSHPARSGVVIATGESHQAALELAKKAVDTIKITMRPNH